MHKQNTTPKPASPERSATPTRIAIFVFDGMSLFEFGIAVELFTINRLKVPHWYETFVFAETTGTIRTSDGVEIHATRDLKSIRNVDKVLVPGWAMDTTLTPLSRSAFRTAHERGAEFISFCSGSFALAEAGILDGRRATTHWAFSDSFRNRFKEVELVDGVLFVNEDRIATSAGSAAAIDLSLHIIRRDFGVEIANGIAQRLVASPARSGSQHQYIERPVQDESNCIATCCEWALRNLFNQSLTVDAMANVANLSRRSFDRNFRKVTGDTPNVWITNQRLDQATALLEKTDQSIEQIATKVGFGSSTTFRQCFNRRYHMSPSQYRKSKTC